MDYEPADAASRASRSPSPQRHREDQEERRSRTPERPRHRSDSRGRRSPPPVSKPRHAPNDPEPTKVVGVFGLSVRTVEQDLEDEFGRIAPVDKVVIVYDARTSRSRGFGFVTMKSVEDATAVIKELNGIELHGRRLRVDYSVTHRPHDPTPGEYRGEPRRDDFGMRGGPPGPYGPMHRGGGGPGWGGPPPPWFDGPQGRPPYGGGFGGPPRGGFGGGYGRPPPPGMGMWGGGGGGGRPPMRGGYGGPPGRGHYNDRRGPDGDEDWRRSGRDRSTSPAPRRRGRSGSRSPPPRRARDDDRGGDRDRDRDRGDRGDRNDRGDRDRGERSERERSDRGDRDRSSPPRRNGWD